MTRSAGCGLLFTLLLAACCGSPPAAPPPLPTSLYGEVATAVEQARDTVVRTPRSAAAWGELAMLFDAHDQLPEAQQCYRQAR